MVTTHFRKQPRLWTYTHCLQLQAIRVSLTTSLPYYYQIITFTHHIMTQANSPVLTGVIT